jgi:hypothetical protein
MHATRPPASLTYHFRLIYYKTQKEFFSFLFVITFTCKSEPSPVHSVLKLSLNLCFSLRVTGYAHTKRHVLSFLFEEYVRLRVERNCSPWPK